MDNLIIYPSAILGVLLICIYTYRCYLTKTEFDMSKIVTAILSSTGVIGGLVLVGAFFSDQLKGLVQQIELYVLISGLVVLATSIQSIKKDFFDTTRPKTDPKTSSTLQNETTP
ncbi:Threonyl-tRNA synthetase [Candidatus Terasakiella magnetica]|uniref:Threonyl-tRNA synthetase n=1 Tax=Candidatus Terasakiella magnetica TaxID=1867952 RepID=A0A1C3RHI3_9PROT|nr:hypothetical protein [Candidatus Terasakiella magnetica]SCA56740.1 Threonyl-tRNA synthetase [Candidatus Terasakiella magnetica]